MITRRAFAKTAPIAAVGMTTAACSKTGGGLDPTIVVQIISGVQQAVADGCKAAGDFVPTAKSILDIIGTLTGTVTATDAIKKIADMILGTACPSAAAAASPRPAGQRERAPQAVKVNGVSVDFIKF